ncbi:hypothetical protein [Streptomyces mirabilis]|jgi:hypothetical protein|uniref:Zinc-binding dehydrogenase n=1 Tax=Streptomyces mirabilis TaxID=68239 RepID=A0A1I2S2A4_9ACTN|nr:hypothetical protein [Streptomyces mirabilis]SFG46962.1 hypothetical protein SAMN02787118_12179 [Streptomyces mirabilis]
MRAVGFRVDGGVEVLEALICPNPCRLRPGEALRLLAAGRIRPGVTQTLSLAEAAKARHLLETGTGQNKILLSLT